MDDDDSGVVHLANAQNTDGFDKGDVLVSSFIPQGSSGSWTEPQAIDGDSRAIGVYSLSVSVNSVGRALVSWQSFDDLDQESDEGFVNAVLYE